jgi:hypothetical protein
VAKAFTPQLVRGAKPTCRILVDELEFSIFYLRDLKVGIVTFHSIIAKCSGVVNSDRESIYYQYAGRFHSRKEREEDGRGCKAIE